jgi:hypothetical protein
MAPLGKERAASPTPSTTTIGTSATVADLTAGLAKVPILEVAKPEPFYRSRQKFKAFYIQVRLRI